MIIFPDLLEIEMHSDEKWHTTTQRRVLKQKRVYPTIFRFLVSIFGSFYASIAVTPTANGWYTRVSTLDGW